jgi:hypothetical protein
MKLVRKNMSLSLQGGGAATERSRVSSPGGSSAGDGVVHQYSQPDGLIDQWFWWIARAFTFVLWSSQNQSKYSLLAKPD